MPRLPLTLIVATAPNLGIGLRGALPWRIKAEMAYFARVTTRLPPTPPTSSTSSTSTSPTRNAVIMGRKTWSSIPPRFRPLKDRTNIVLSTTAEAGTHDGATWCANLESALKALQADKETGRAFVIGGVGVYAEALGKAERVLLTRVHGEWECDAFFPVDLDAESSGWRRAGLEETRTWVGEEVPEGSVKEGEVEFEYRMYVRQEEG
ncbi:hypothetical protein BT63DRAFT_419594 [Microthyrium microscopicum]|uniref:Dihydrofolate reductase n=1 Tax=Microthyrium microscopicum TaxID=703497 RepID=A0A6A6USB3_9PEZI|nr:hypothetical protein BT63DRAFT_419594 [Microthyrium microscopicum]